MQRIAVSKPLAYRGVITVTITEPERKSMLQFARASPASRASFCYVASIGRQREIDGRPEVCLRCPRTPFPSVTSIHHPEA